MAETMTREQKAAKETTQAARRGAQLVREGEPAQAAMEAQEMIPSSVFAYAAGASILASLVLFFTRDRKDWSLFVGQWAPMFLLTGVFYKLLRPSKELTSQE